MVCPTSSSGICSAAGAADAASVLCVHPAVSACQVSLRCAALENARCPKSACPHDSSGLRILWNGWNLVRQN